MLTEKRAPVLAYFNPGLPKEDILSFFNAHNITPIPSLVALYEWHNGVKTVYGIHDALLELIAYGKFFNLEEMIRMREIFKEWGEDDFTDLDNYIPFLGSGESDMFLLKLTTGQVLAWQPMIQVFGELEFNSIDALLDCVMECLEVGALTIDPIKGLKTDFNRYAEIQKKYVS